MSSTRTGRKYSPSSEGVVSDGFARGIAGAGARLASRLESHEDVKIVFPKGGSRDSWLQTTEHEDTAEHLIKSFVDDSEGDEAVDALDEDYLPEEKQDIYTDVDNIWKEMEKRDEETGHKLNQMSRDIEMLTKAVQKLIVAVTQVRQ